jgi:hypothetical protein
MEQQPLPDKSTVKQHQDAVVDIFPKAEKSLYGKSPFPNFIRTYQIGHPEQLGHDYDKQELLKTILKQVLPAIYESYAGDLTLLQAHNPDATLLGVQYDPYEEKITSPAVYLKDTFISEPQIQGSMGRTMRVRAEVESDYIASIQKRTLIINDEGLPEDLYILEITRHNSTVYNDVHSSWTGQDGDVVCQIAVDTSYDNVFAEAAGGTVNRSAILNSAVDVLEKAFPATTK